MDPVDVTVLSCVYGDSHDRFLRRWGRGIGHLDPAPAAVIVASDKPRRIANASVVGPGSSNTTWFHPQPFYLQQALNHAKSEWVWIHDIDDVAFPDALQGIEEVEADVFQMGYQRSDGEIYLPPTLTGSQVVEASTNPFVGGSCIRTDLLLDVGFPDVALQDWALWRKLARVGATFAASDRPRFHYMRHPDTRGARELTFADRDRHVREMLAWEAEHAVAA